MNKKKVVKGTKVAVAYLADGCVALITGAAVTTVATILLPKGRTGLEVAKAILSIGASVCSGTAAYIGACRMLKLNPNDPFEDA